jgi:hypothetical protein
MKDIQVICYTYVHEKTPSFTLLKDFLTTNHQDIIYFDYFQKLLDISTKYPVGYGIKQSITGDISFELYFYQLDPTRLDHLDMYTVDNFPKHILETFDPCMTKYSWEEEVYILSLDIDKDYLEQKKKTITYYFRPKDVYFFTHKVNEQGVITKYNSDYSVAYIYNDVIDQYPEWYQKACFYQPNIFHMFIGSKDNRTRFGYYLQKISYERFLDFLIAFQYHPAFIELCKESYSSDYIFDVGFDFLKDGSLSKSTLYGILHCRESS